jgi:hypothetical protein
MARGDSEVTTDRRRRRWGGKIDVLGWLAVWPSCGFAPHDEGSRLAERVLRVWLLFCVATSEENHGSRSHLPGRFPPSEPRRTTGRSCSDSYHGSKSEPILEPTIAGYCMIYCTEEPTSAHKNA